MENLVIYTANYKSPIGNLEVRTTDEFVMKIIFSDKARPASKIVPPILKKMLKQLDEYFKGKRKDFDVDYLILTTPYQEKVLKQVIKIPYGKTKSYAEVAKLTKNPNAARAVGSANRNNPLPIVIPCHRVIGSDGKMTGYAGKNGITKKQWLLNLEKGKK